MTREVAKICEKRAPGINRIIIKYMQHYIVIRLKYSMMFVPFRRGCCCCCCFFFLPEYRYLSKQLNVLDTYA